MSPRHVLVALSLLIAAPAAGDPSSREAARAWFRAGERAVHERAATPAWPSRARNAILVVGDGMGTSTVTAARILEGQQRGAPGEENRLSFERFPSLALVKVYSVNQQVPDSAPTMTALVTGVKTGDGMLAVDESVARGDAAGVAGHELVTLIEMAERRGLATGIVTTTRITHATPAACYAHSPDRNWEWDGAMPEAVRATGFPDIARQLVESTAEIDVVMGGGRLAFLPDTMTDPEDASRKGRRLDGRDLIAEWRARRGERARVAFTREQLLALDPAVVDPVLGLFAPSHLAFEADRTEPGAGDPTLAEMAAHAVRALSRSPRGFVLVVEGGRIDHGHHEGSARRALVECIELSRAVAEIVRLVDLRETLVIVTADHGHPLHVSGDVTRGNPILGLVVGNDSQGRPRPQGSWTRDLLGLPFATLSYANGPGHAGATDSQPAGAKTWPHAPRSASPAAAGRVDWSAVDMTGPDVQHESLVPLVEDEHSGEDVPAYATGAGSRLVSGTLEQNALFFVMTRALGWKPESP